MQKRRHDFAWEIPDRPVWIDADPARIAQILDNLLANAAKYTPDGGRVRLALASDEQCATVRVEDNGIGFRAGSADKLFGLFSRDDAGIARSEGGLGIGLALVREFAERHGGTVTAESDGPMKGSAFTLRLPLARPL
jgi:signal transduction histidine kinase